MAKRLIGKYEFEIVDTIPSGYMFYLTTPFDVKSEYLPLVPLNDGNLKCIRLNSVEDVVAVMKGACYVPNADLEKLKRYYEKNKKDAEKLPMYTGKEKRKNKTSTKKRKEYKCGYVLRAIKALERNGIK